VVRCFVDDDIIHVDGNVDPLRDVEIINLELILADMAQIEKKLEKSRKDKFKTTPEELAALEKVNDALVLGKPARQAGLTVEEEFLMKGLLLLTMKPVIYAANVSDADMAKGNDLSKIIFDFAASEGSTAVLVSAQVESELALLEPEDKAEYLLDLGVSEEQCGLKALVRAAYVSLGLQTYFTSGPTETRAWTINIGMTAPQAAGMIHSDFEKGFIRAETISYKDMIACGSEKAVKDTGLMRSEGRDYVMQEGDIVLFRFNV
jgi:GTP-binding protein YchF